MNSDFLLSKQSKNLKGSVRIPADKSMSHRALLLASIALGETKIFNLLESYDVLATKEAVKTLGIKVLKNQDGSYSVFGKGLYGLKQPKEAIDCQNAGTLARLILGLLSVQNFNSTLIGDASLSKRPMKRVIKPLSMMGANFSKQLGNDEITLPLSVLPSKELNPLSYVLEQASAQVKSALLLAGLYCKGKTEIIESAKTRDHSENMLKYLGFDISSQNCEEGNKIILKSDAKDFIAKDFYISADFSSSAFFIVACLIANDSSLSLHDININPLRSGLLNTLLKMGADIKIEKNQNNSFIEDVANIYIKSSELKAVEVNKNQIPLMIDEIPILCIAAAFAEGVTKINGIAELRVKESNRVESTVKGLRELGINAYEEQDSIIVHGNNGQELEKNAVIDSFNDHRIAMSFLVAGLKNKLVTKVLNTKEIATSFPGFVEKANEIGLKIAKN